MMGLLLLLLACEGQTPDAVPAVASAPGAAPMPASRAPGGPPAVSASVGTPTPAAAFHATPTFELVGDVSATPKSIVLISLDTASAQHMGPYGGPATMANLADLAGAGVRFDQAVSHFPETCLSHWSMWTGVPPEAHGNAPGARGSETT
ncbi:MAG: sulfatase-like hydrolase/transferase, partial [Myxococcota bacterium]|nr:sulfatase-like hydrolase/transferase [Myxococcota bacterium]